MTDQNETPPAVEGIIDDVPKDPTPPVEKATAGPSELVRGLQDQLDAANRQNKTLSSDREELIQNFAKASGLLEGANIATYNKETGALTRTVQKEEGPDEAAILLEKITAKERDLHRQHLREDITADQYHEAMQDHVQPMKDERRDLIANKRFAKLEKQITDQQKAPEARPEAPATTKEGRDVEAFAKIVNDFPDTAEEKGSPLLTKMSELQAADPQVYGNVDNNHVMYRYLATQAENALRSEGIETKNAQQSMNNQHLTPGNRGYQEPVKDMSLSHEDQQYLVSHGYKSQALINRIGAIVKRSEEVGYTEMDD